MSFDEFSALAGREDIAKRIRGAIIYEGWLKVLRLEKVKLCETTTAE